MATERRQFIGYSTESANQNFLGMPREMTVDLAKKTLVMHDGYKKGGYPMAREDLANVPSEAKESFLSATQPKLTSEQQEAVDSGITSDKVNAYDTLNFTIKNTQISSSNWVPDARIAGFGYANTVTIDTGDFDLASRVPMVVFSPSEANTGIYSASCYFNGTDEITIFASEIPESDFTLTAIVFL